MLTIVILSVLGLFVIVALIKTFPDIVRYMKMRSM